MSARKQKSSDNNTKKTRVELRFDTDLYKRLQVLTGKLDVSVNRFLEAIAQWAVANAVVGYPILDPVEGVEVTEQPGAVFFGSAADKHFNTPGRVHFAIEFNAPYAIRNHYDDKNPQSNLF